MKGIKAGRITGFKPGVTQTVVPKTDGAGFEFQRGKVAPWRNTPQTDMMNRYYQEGGQREITRVYGSTSRIIQTTDNNLAVQFKDASGKLQRGWLDKEGYLMGENDMLAALRGLDHAAGLDEFDPDSLTWQYLHGSLKEQAKMADAMKYENWDHIFNEVLYDESSGKFYKADEATIESVQRSVLARMQEAVA